MAGSRVSRKPGEKGQAIMNASDHTENMNDARIRNTINGYSNNGQLACSRAFEAAGALGTSPLVIGRYADEMGLKLVSCQLGLFGYRPEKKIVKPAHPVNMRLAAAIEQNLSGGSLPCIAAFAIALNIGLKKMDVSGACEALEIKIKPCQLGAF